MEKSRKIRKKSQENKKVQILKELVKKNKLKDTPLTSIDDMVKYLEEHNISVQYVAKEE